MIVLIDANAVVGDPYLRSTAWNILAHAARNWNVRLCTTEVVLQEATAGYERRVADSLVGLGRWIEKHGGLMSSRRVVAGLTHDIQEEASHYEQILRDLLAAIPVEVLPIPPIPHETLVRRAALRIPPCDSNGDGYRDTLNWYAVLDLVREEEALYLVTADTDFTDGTGSLHPSLVEEVSQVAADSMVTIIESLANAALTLASQFAKSEEQDIREVQDRLRQENLTEYVATSLLHDKSTLSLSAQSLALPVGAQSPFIADLEDPSEHRVQVKAALEGHESAVEVSFIADTTVLFFMAGDIDPGPAFQETVGPAGERLLHAQKPLRYTALVTVDRFDQPSKGEVISIEALADDPGRLQWRQAARNHLRRQMGLPPSTLEAIRNMGKIDLPPSTLEAIRNIVSASGPSAATPPDQTAAETDPSDVSDSAADEEEDMGQEE